MISIRTFHDVIAGLLGSIVLDVARICWITARVEGKILILFSLLPDQE
jgi:hypothetical protein